MVRGCQSGVGGHAPGDPRVGMDLGRGKGGEVERSGEKWREVERRETV